MYERLYFYGLILVSKEGELMTSCTISLEPGDLAVALLGRMAVKKVNWDRGLSFPSFFPRGDWPCFGPNLGVNGTHDCGLERGLINLGIFLRAPVMAHVHDVGHAVGYKKPFDMHFGHALLAHDGWDVPPNGFVSGTVLDAVSVLATHPRLGSVRVPHWYGNGQMVEAFHLSSQFDGMKIAIQTVKSDDGGRHRLFVQSDIPIDATIGYR